jgi:hypothetical protein
VNSKSDCSRGGPSPAHASARVGVKRSREQTNHPTAATIEVRPALDADPAEVTLGPRIDKEGRGTTSTTTHLDIPTPPDRASPFPPARLLLHPISENDPTDLQPQHPHTWDVPGRWSADVRGGEHSGTPVREGGWRGIRRDVAAGGSWRVAVGSPGKVLLVELMGS